MTFEEFHARADKLIAKKYGLGIDDFSDAPWWDSWNDMSDFDDESILTEAENILSESDDLFAAMKEEMDS